MRCSKTNKIRNFIVKSSSSIFHGYYFYFFTYICFVRVVECGKEFVHDDQKCRVRDLKHFALPSSTKSCPHSLRIRFRFKLCESGEWVRWDFYTASPRLVSYIIYLIEVWWMSLLEGRRVESWRVRVKRAKKYSKKQKRKRQIFNFLNNINFSRSTFSSFQTRLTRSHLTREHTNATVLSFLSFYAVATLFFCCSFLFTLNRCTSFVIRSTFLLPKRSLTTQQKKQKTTNRRIWH